MKPPSFYTLLVYVAVSITALSTLDAQIPAFPSAEGFGATATTGGRGGQVVYVTNLNCSGPGSLTAALSNPNTKYILFTVSGIIDCAAEIEWGNCYIAGQTSPGGITVRGILIDDFYESSGLAQNIIIRHLNSRPNTAAERAANGYLLDDALRIDGARRVVIDHCSLANAIDETVQLSRSSNISIQYCMLAEPVGGHYDLGGMLLNYSTTAHRRDSLSIHHNIWNRVGGRMPEISCEPSGEVPGDMDCLAHPLQIEISNNVFWDMPIQMYYEPLDEFLIRPNFVNNYAVGRNSYGGAMFHHPMLDHVGNEIYSSGNRLNLYPAYADYDLFYCCNDFNLYNPNTDLGTATLRSTRFNYPPLTYTPTDNLLALLAQKVGAFNSYSPTRRDSMNRRQLQPMQFNTIDPTPVDGNDYYNDAYLSDFTALPAPPTDTDNDGMPDYWETAHATNPNLADPNNTSLSVSITGIAGYTNLECYLNCLSDALVNGETTPPCGIQLGNCNINGIHAVCTNGTYQYSITPGPSGSTYIWTVGNGTITSGQGTNTITVQWNNTGIGDVNVTVQ